MVLLAACLLLILAFGGIDIGLGPLQLRLHDWFRPLVLLTVTSLVRVWLAPRAPLAPHLATCALLSLLVAIIVAYSQHHVRFAGGLDSYGYVSAASLLASGHVTEPQRLVTL